MTKMTLEIEGSADEVVRVVQQLGGVGQRATAGDVGGTKETATGSGGQTTQAAGVPMAGVSYQASPGAWTEALARDFLAGLPPPARLTVLHVWRAGAAGIHRSVLCQRAELTPMELRSAVTHMGHALRRFQRERGANLSRPVAVNSPRQSYFVDADFAAVANSRMFGDGMSDRRTDGAERP